MKIIKKQNAKVKVLEGANISHLIVPALAYQRSPSIQKPLDFLDDLESLDITSDSIADVMKVCKKLYQRDFICGAALDALVNFAASGVTIEPTGNKKFDDIVRIFIDNMNVASGDDRGLYHFSQRFCLNWFIYGNVFPLRQYQIINVGSFRASIPTRIILLNPQNIALVSNAVTQFGPKQLYYKLSDDFVELLKSDGRKNREKRNIPEEFRRKIKKLPSKNPMKEVYAIPLPEQLVTHIKRKALDFDDWGVPYLTRAFRPISTLNKLIRLDEATLDGLINQFNIYKIGSDEFPADASRLRAFADLIKARGAPEPNQNIVWQHDIDVISIGPDGKILSFEKRFEQALTAIKIALGVADVLLYGEKLTGDLYASFLSMLENLMHLRQTITVWIQDTLMQIADENNIVLEGYPNVSWERSNLTNEAEIKNLILSFYDRGLLDPATAIEESGREPEAIIEKKKKQREDGTAELFTPPTLPFDGGNNNPADQDGRAKDGDVNKKKENTDFESTASLISKADKHVFQSIFDGAIEYLEKKYSSPKSKIRTPDVTISYIIGKYEQLRRHITSVNDINRVHGIAAACQGAVDGSYDRVINALSIGELISELKKEKTKLWHEIAQIRSEG